MGENKIFQFMTADEAAEVRPARAKSKAKSKGKNPMVIRERLDQRIWQLSTRIDKLEDAAESEVNSLKITIAKAQRRLLEIEFEAMVTYIDELDDDVFAQVEAEYVALTAKDDEPEDVADEAEAEAELE